MASLDFLSGGIFIPNSSIPYENSSSPALNGVPSSWVDDSGSLKGSSGTSSTRSSSGGNSAGKAALNAGKDALNIAKDAGIKAIRNNPITGVPARVLGIGGSGGIIAQLQQWLQETNFFWRAAMVIIALILLAAAFSLLAKGQVSKVASQVLKS